MWNLPIVKTYKDALLIIALLRVVESKSLNLIFVSERMRSSFTAKAFRMGHIKKISVRETNKKKERKDDTYIQITKAGVEFLAREYDLFLCALSNRNVVVFDNSENHSSKKTSAGRETTGILIANAAGAYIPVSTFGTTVYDEEENENGEGDNDTEASASGKIPLRLFYQNMIAEESLLDISILSKHKTDADDLNITYYSSRLVKEMLAMESIRGSMKDYGYDRYAGILDSKKKCILLYCAPRFTMSWASWYMMSELSSYQFWARTNSAATIQQQDKTKTTAAFVVNNARDFAYHYNTERIGKEKSEVFGGLFAHMYIIPNDRNGAWLLNWLASNDDDLLPSSLTNFAIESGEYSANTSDDAKLFPLLDCEQRKTSLCFLLDARQINAIKRSTEKNPEQYYQIMCFDWQQDYLERVLPDNIIYRSFPLDAIIP